MARRKITIEDAFATLEQAGIQVQVKSVKEEEVVEQRTPVKRNNPYGQTDAFHKEKEGAKTVKVTLYARHSIGSGGYQVVVDGEKQMFEAGVQSYGPGVVTVPVEIAGHLQHQDRLAREADARMLDRTCRSFLVVQKNTLDGQRSNVPMFVDDSVLDNLGNLPANLMHVLR